MGVEAGTDGSAADREVVETVERLLETLDIAVEEAGPAAELLSDREWDGVLQVRAADLDDGVELLRLGKDGVAHAGDRGDESVFHALGGGNVHGGGKSVVRGLRHVDVIVGMDGLLR